MPIPFENLKYNDILCHQAAYECFDRAGKELFPEWDIVGFEKAVLGDGDSRYLSMAEKIKEDGNLFGKLNTSMPFLRFREKGQHYGYELFLSPPSFWGSRGAPLWWAYAARQFTFDKLPMDELALYEKYNGIAKKFEINMNYDGYNYIERFAAGGMSSGVVGSQFVRRGWRTIRNRNRLYTKEEVLNENIYLDRAKEQIDRYCKNFGCGTYEVVPNLTAENFMYAVQDSEITSHQKDTVFLLWGIYSGKPLSYAETAAQKAVTVNRIRQIESTFLRHLLRNKNRGTIVQFKENEGESDFEWRL